MDALNQLATRLAQTFASAKPGTRAAALIAAILLLVGGAYVLTAPLRQEGNYLFGGQAFTPSEISAMEAAFGKANLGDYTVDGARIAIPRAQQAAYLAALADHGALPAKFGDYLAQATVQVSPFTSRAQQDEIIKAAKQRELALIICAMQGIEKAAVHYDARKTGGLHASTITTASVSVKPEGSRPLEARQVDMVRHLVASAIAGLDPEHVTVVDLNGRAYSAGGVDRMGLASDDPYLTRMREYQSIYEGMIRSALSYIPGVTVTVSVELDRQVFHRPAGDGPTERPASDVQTLTPRRVTASVGVPSKYFENVWRHRPAPAGTTAPSPIDLGPIEKEESDKIRAHVARLLPESEGPGDRAAALVTVTTFSNFDAPTTVFEPLASPTTQPNDRRTAVAVVIVAAVLLLTGVWTAFRPQTSTVARRIDAAHPRSDATSAGPPSQRSTEAFQFLRQSGHDELRSLLVNERPQTIALVLSHLPSKQASGVLSALSPDLQAEVIQRWVGLHEASPEIVEEVERGLQSRIVDLLRDQRQRAAGMASVGSILSAMDDPGRDTMLAALAARNGDLARSLGFAERAITDLDQLPDAALSQVLAKADTEIVRLALAAQSPSMSDRILRLLPSDQAASLRREVGRLGPTRLRDVQRAQDELMRLASRLDAEGRVGPPPQRPTASAA